MVLVSFNTQDTAPNKQRLNMHGLAVYNTIQSIEDVRTL